MESQFSSLKEMLEPQRDSLAKDPKLSDRLNELLGSRLCDHNVVTPDFRITAGRQRRKSQHFDELFRTFVIRDDTYAVPMQTVTLQPVTAL